MLQHRRGDAGRIVDARLEDLHRLGKTALKLAYDLGRFRLRAL
jgi:hypothetical protein